MKIPARAPLTKQAQRTQVSPGPQIPQRGLAREVGALGAQPGRSTESLDGTRTVDYSRSRDSMQSGDAPSSSMSERFVGDGHLRLTGRNDARCTGCHGIRGTRATRCHRHVRVVFCRLSTVPITRKKRRAGPAHDGAARNCLLLW